MRREIQSALTAGALLALAFHQPAGLQPVAAESRRAWLGALEVEPLFMGLLLTERSHGVEASE